MVEKMSEQWQYCFYKHPLAVKIKHILGGAGWAPGGGSPGAPVAQWTGMIYVLTSFYIMF